MITTIAETKQQIGSGLSSITYTPMDPPARFTRKRVTKPDNSTTQHHTQFKMDDVTSDDAQRFCTHEINILIYNWDRCEKCSHIP